MPAHDKISAGHPLDGAAGAKRAPRAGQDDRVDIAVLAHVDPDLLQFVMDHCVDCVERVGPIDRDRRDPLGHFDFEEFIIAVIGRHDRKTSC